MGDCFCISTFFSLDNISLCSPSCVGTGSLNNHTVKVSRDLERLGMQTAVPIPFDQTQSLRSTATPPSIEEITDELRKTTIPRDANESDSSAPASNVNMRKYPQNKALRSLRKSVRAVFPGQKLSDSPSDGLDGPIEGPTEGPTEGHTECHTEGPSPSHASPSTGYVITPEVSSPAQITLTLPPPPQLSPKELEQQKEKEEKVREKMKQKEEEITKNQKTKKLKKGGGRGKTKREIRETKR
jgi:hypothetical protein